MVRNYKTINGSQILYKSIDLIQSESNFPFFTVKIAVLTELGSKEYPAVKESRFNASLCTCGGGTGLLMGEVYSFSRYCAQLVLLLTIQSHLHVRPRH